MQTSQVSSDLQLPHEYRISHEKSISDPRLKINKVYTQCWGNLSVMWRTVVVRENATIMAQVKDIIKIIVKLLCSALF
jgi:hypothetical protein